MTATERVELVRREFPLIGSQYIKACRDAGLSDEEILERMKEILDRTKRLAEENGK